MQTECEHLLVCTLQWERANLDVFGSCSPVGASKDPEGRLCTGGFRNSPERTLAASGVQYVEQESSLHTNNLNSGKGSPCPEPKVSSCVHPGIND